MDPSYAERIAVILADLRIAPDYGSGRGMGLQPETERRTTARVLPNGRELTLLP